MADEREFQRDVLWPKPGMGRVLKVRRIRIGLRPCKVGAQKYVISDQWTVVGAAGANTAVPIM
jgi:hypothetical protein